MPRRVNAGSIVTIATTLIATTTTLQAVVAPAVATSSGQAAATSCDAAATGFTPVLQLDIPQQAGWLNETPPYSLDRTAEVGPNFDRVGYCVELNGPDGPQWVWTAMEPFSTEARRIGLPTRPGELVRQRVSDLDVQSNVPSVTSGTGQTGYLEMWPNQYQESASTQVSNASPITFDVDDNPTSPLGYGSFQVAQIGPTRPSNLAAKQVFAINTFTESDNSTLSLGIGTNAAGQPDWTFANNANRYSQRRFTAYVRTAVVALSESPQDRELIPRDASGGSTVPVAGRVTDPRVRRVQLRVSSNGHTDTYTSNSSTFRFTPRIKAGLQEYSFEVRATGPGLDRVVARRDSVVSGDVYVVQGQSNSEAAKYNGAATWRSRHTCAATVHRPRTPASLGRTGSGTTRPAT